MAQYDLVNMVSMVMLHILLEIIYKVRDTGRTRNLFILGGDRVKRRLVALVKRRRNQPARSVPLTGQGPLEVGVGKHGLDQGHEQGVGLSLVNTEFSKCFHWLCVMWDVSQ